MKKCGLLIICLLAVLSLLITSCSTDRATETPVLQNTETTVIKTEIPATSTPTPAPTPTPEPILCRVAFDSDRDGNLEIYRTNPDGSETINLTNNPGDDHAPAYSPNGDQIAFVSNRDNGQEQGKFIYVMNADGSGVRQLTHEENCEDPDWSHVGTMITYSNNGDIYVIKADGSGNSINLSKESPEEDMQPSWSPDGTKIAWLMKNQWGQNAYVMNADGSNIIQIGNNNQSYSVEWTPDGRLFTGWIWEGKEQNCNNCVSNADGTGIIDAGGKDGVLNYFPFWTASGDRAMIFQVGQITGNEDIFVVGKSLPDTLDMGIGSINISNNPATDRNPVAPINCGGGWVIDTEALGVNAQPTESASQPTEPPVITIGYAGDDPTQWQRKANFQKACEELGIQCEFGGIAELLTKKVSAIVLTSNPEVIMNDYSAIGEATAKSIPVFVLDAEIDMDGAYSIMADQGDMIRATLDELFKETEDAGEFAYFDFSPSQADAQNIKAILEKEYPKIKVVTTDTKKYNIQTDKVFVVELLAAYPTLKAIWTNDGYANALFGIVEQISDPTMYPTLKCEPTKDGFYLWKDRVAEHPGFRCVAVSNPPGIAYDAVYAAYYLINGETIDGSALGGEFVNAFLVDFPVITNENLSKELEIIEYEDGNYVVDRLMTADEIMDRWFK